jgi:hypothetical protein
VATTRSRVCSIVISTEVERSLNISGDQLAQKYLEIPRLEVIQARALGLEVAGFSCLTNLATGLSKEKLSYEEVLEVGKRAASEFARLLQTVLLI